MLFSSTDRRVIRVGRVLNDVFRRGSPSEEEEGERSPWVLPSKAVYIVREKPEREKKVGGNRGVNLYHVSVS